MASPRTGKLSPQATDEVPERSEDVSEDVSRLRADYTTMRYCFDDKDFENALEGFAGKIGF